MSKQLTTPKRLTAKHNGVVLHEDQHRVVIMTGFKPSSNRKTGEMLQVWILVKDLDPIQAYKTKQDILICGDCPHRWASDGACYVNIGQAPLSIYRAWKRDRYASGDEWVEYYQNFVLQNNLQIRWGAYGDPVHIPLAKVVAWNSFAYSWTGYTHQWRNRPDYVGIFQASCDSLQDKHDAEKLGWKTFRVLYIPHNAATDAVIYRKQLERDEMICPATISDTTCSKCNKCNGRSKNVVVQVHGARKSKFVHA
jgi:hypothetical protein